MTDTPRTAHGFQFQSAIDLHGLRAGDGEEVEVVTGTVAGYSGELVGEWTEIPGKRARTTVHVLSRDAFRVMVGSMARFLVEPAGITAEFDPAVPPPLQSKLLMSTPVALLLYSRGTMGLHAGAVDVGGEAILIAASGGMGKTTLTTAFHLAGHRLLGDDLAAVTSDGAVLPAQALVRFRPETATWMRAKMSDTRHLWSADGHEFHEIDLPRRGSGEPVPIKALVVLDWSEDEPRLTPFPSPLAIQALWDKTFYLADGRGAAMTLDRLGALADAVPTFRFDRPRGLDRLEATVDFLVSELLAESGA